MAAPPKVGFVSLGCPKALVDSEGILTRLRAEGYAISPSYEGADLVVVNTCGFIESAVRESLDAIGEALAENGRVIVTGCLGAKGDVVREAHPKVLAVTGPHALEEVMTAVHEHLPKPHDPFTDLVPPQGIKLTPRHYAYLKISEGCNHRCSFCIIPSLRGFWGGRPVRTRMSDLAVALGELAGRDAASGVWVRLHYVYPYPHVDEVIALMAEGKILPYIDVPFQHASRRILKLMKRPASGEDNLERIRAWRTTCPDITIRSTFIAGFPGETESEFRELLDFLEEAELDRVGCFAYSPVQGAKANELPRALPEEVREDRRARLMQLQEKISARRLERKVGKTLKVLVDEVKPEGAVARSAADAPEIDGVVHIEGAGRLAPGDWAQVKVFRSDTHDLFARPAASRRLAA